MASDERRLVFSDQFVISCGTVSVDISKRKVLLIRWRSTGEHMLPKGRKDLGESLEETAVRETFEETGFRVKLRPVAIPTLATLPSSVLETAEAGLGPPGTVTEPIAMTQRTTTNGALKVIFWFVGEADSTSIREEGTQEADEDFNTVWADFDQLESVISFEDDRRVTQAAINAICKTAS
jgi:8-oxo-dGTP pyrophosphatase MutT (NUDIX family)